jgi:sodium transport system permease protein
MRFDFVWRVAIKDIVSTFRDSRAFRSFLMMPFILTPLFFIALPLVFSQTLGREAEIRQKVAVQSLVALPQDFRKLLEGKNGFELIEVVDVKAAVQSEKVNAGLQFPPNGLPTIADGSTVKVEVIAKLTNQRGLAVKGKLEDFLNAYGRNLVVAKLLSLGVPASTLEPIQVVTVNAETKEEQSGGIFAFLLPFLLFNAILAGAQLIAIDATAGEKERGSLEILLVSPVKRTEVVAGKLFAVTIFALFSVVVQSIAFLLTGAIAPLVLSQESGSSISAMFSSDLSLSPTFILNLLLIGVATALLISGLLVAVCIYARSFKEAQSYMTPFVLVTMFSSFGLQFADFITRSPALYATPVIGTVIGILDLMKGKLGPDLVMIIIGSNLILAVLMAYLAYRNFLSEQVLFRN